MLFRSGPALDVLNDTQLVLAGAERRVLDQQHPLAARIGDAGRDLLAAVEELAGERAPR